MEQNTTFNRDCTNNDLAYLNRMYQVKTDQPSRSNIIKQPKKLKKIDFKGEKFSQTITILNLITLNPVENQFPNLTHFKSSHCQLSFCTSVACWSLPSWATDFGVDNTVLLLVPKAGGCKLGPLHCCLFFNFKNKNASSTTWFKSEWWYVVGSES